MKAEHLERLVTVEMPFGKYQGRLIADLPSFSGCTPPGNVSIPHL